MIFFYKFYEYSESKNNPYDPEIIADKYAADLLLPLYIFSGVVNQYDKVTFNTISSKVSSTQKAKYIKEAESLNLSLSEWICGTLDMSINAYEDVNRLTEIKQLQEENDEKVKKINSLKGSLEIVKLHLEYKKEKVLLQAKTIKELKKLIQNQQKE